MGARDIFHQAVKTALTKEQWHITADPLLLQVGGIDMYVDLGAEKLLAAEKDHQQIAVEVKSFLEGVWKFPLELMVMLPAHHFSACTVVLGW